MSHGWEKVLFHPGRLWQQPCCEVGGTVQHGAKFPKYSLHSTVVHNNRQYPTCSKANPGSLNIRISKLWSFSFNVSVALCKADSVHHDPGVIRESTCSNALSSRGPRSKQTLGDSRSRYWDDPPSKELQTRVPASSFPKDHTEQTSCGGSLPTQLCEQLSGRPCPA